MVGDVVGRVGLAERGQGVAQSHSLVQGGEGPEAQPLAQRGLADEHQGERAGGVHVRVGQKTQFFELVGA